MTQMDESTVVDFRQVFKSFPGNLLLLAAAPPWFTILAATDTYLRTTGSTRSELMGRPLFEHFPQYPDDPAATLTRDTLASLE